MLKKLLNFFFFKLENDFTRVLRGLSLSLSWINASSLACSSLSLASSSSRGSRAA